MMKGDTCAACLRPIIFANMGGKLVTVEEVKGGRGDVALTEDLLERRTPLASKVATRTGYRLHAPHCRGLKSFSKPFRREAIR